MGIGMNGFVRQSESENTLRDRAARAVGTTRAGVLVAGVLIGQLATQRWEQRAVSGVAVGAADPDREQEAASASPSSVTRATAIDKPHDYESHTGEPRDCELRWRSTPEQGGRIRPCAAADKGRQPH
jgi:hypothetical protein